MKGKKSTMIWFEQFPIVSLCRQDILMFNHERREEIKCLTDDEVKEIAQKMRDAYLSSGFWSDVKEIATQILDDKKEANR